jgi:hypothetical protein
MIYRIQDAHIRVYETECSAQVGTLDRCQLRDGFSRRGIIVHMVAPPHKLRKTDCFTRNGADQCSDDRPPY